MDGSPPREQAATATGADVIKKFDANGEPVRGARRANPQQAAIDAPGVSPRAIAKQLDREGAPSRSGKGWGASTIHGNWQRGTGILNKELYIGRQVWNRLRFIKDPRTGKRISRLNPQSEWITHDVPELRVIRPGQVKARQGAMQGSRSRGSGPGDWDGRRPRYLFTGLMRCGVCHRGGATWNRVYIGS